MLEEHCWFLPITSRGTSRTYGDLWGSQSPVSREGECYDLSVVRTPPRPPPPTHTHKDSHAGSLLSSGVKVVATLGGVIW